MVVSKWLFFLMLQLSCVRNAASAMPEGSADRKSLDDLLANIPQASTLQGLQSTPSHTPQATPPGTPPVHSKKQHKGEISAKGGRLYG